MKRVALVSLGCAKNLVDSEVMLGILEKQQYDLVPEIEMADVIVINTCGFIHPARQEARDVIRKAILEKTRTKSKKIIVAGCFVQRSQDSLRKAFPEVDAWTGVTDFDKIGQIIEGKSYKNAKNCFLYDHTSPRLLSTPPAWAYVKISEGCSKSCSFCAIPLIKGPYRSRNIPSVAEEARKLVSKGIREINLVSQDTTFYGKDLRLKDGLVLLLKELLNIDDLGWIRILYSYPEEITDSLLEIMCEEKICSYLDIPFQHSHPYITKRMKRGLDGKKSLKLLKRIRKKNPDIVIRTSLVVGFPGEGKQEFRDLKSFVAQARFDHLGVFIYSPEEGTSCYELGDPVKESVKMRRKEDIMDIQSVISYENNRKYIGLSIEALIEGTLKEDESLMVGRGQFQAPEVDGIIFISTEERKTILFNSIQKVEITGRDVYDLYGNINR
ncbi:MAG: 30S ribosomal protein S12 methylthiotransferase RimO [Candidatus Aminicenantes bacterium]|nr:MAG: 30S ribosomal protein S12 methylthiotransferase RimO [Candidatus Aminicenantes bacterium]